MKQIVKGGGRRKCAAPTSLKRILSFFLLISILCGLLDFSVVKAVDTAFVTGTELTTSVGTYDNANVYLVKVAAETNRLYFSIPDGSSFAYVYFAKDAFETLADYDQTEKKYYLGKDTANYETAKTDYAGVDIAMTGNVSLDNTADHLLMQVYYNDDSIAYLLVEWAKASTVETVTEVTGTELTTSVGTYDNANVYLVKVAAETNRLYFSIPDGSNFAYVYFAKDAFETLADYDQTEKKYYLGKDTANYETAKTDYAGVDIAMTGNVSLDNTADHLLMQVYYNDDSIAYLLVEWAKNISGTINKTLLRAAIDYIENNATNYYQSGDRYNGRETDTITDRNSGFWAELTAANGPLVNAQVVYAKNNATQAEVDAATAELEASIAKLIPIEQINATALYEAATTAYGWFNHEATEKANPPVAKRNTTAASWNAYQSALAAANGELVKLFYQEGDTIPDGKQVGDATPYNNTSGDAAQNAVDALTALQAAVSGLDQLALSAGNGESPQLETAKLAYDGLDKLANKLFHPDALDQSRYTAASWTTYEAARADALNFLNTHSRPDDTAGYKECLTYTDAYHAFWSACYEGLTGTAAKVWVELNVTDSYDLLAGNPVSAYAGNWSLELDVADATVAGALRAALGSGYNLNKADNHYQLGVYLNGIYLFDMINSSAELGIASRAYENVRLLDGDILVVAMMYAPTRSFGLLGQEKATPAKEILSAVQYQFLRFTADGEEVRIAEGTAGQPVALNVSYMLAHPIEYNGRITAKTGAHVYISEAYATEAEARRAGASEDSGVVTDDNGNFSLSLNSAPGSNDGWYVVSVVGDGENGGLLNGANLLLHVQDDADLSALKEVAKESLNELLNAYDDDFYTEVQLAEIQSVYETAIAAIDAASNSGDIRTAQETGENAIRAIQQVNEESTARRLASLTRILALLPTLEETEDGKLYQPDGVLLDLLFGSDGLYSARMTPYQKKQLSVAEDSLLNALEAIYGELQAGTKTLEARPAFQVHLRVINSQTNEDLTCGVFVSPAYYLFSNMQLTDEDEFLYDAVNPVSLGDRVAEFTLPAEGLYFFFPNSYLTDQTAYQLDYIDYGVDDHYMVAGGGNQLYALRGNTEIVMYVVPVGTSDSSESYIAALDAEFNTYTRSDYSAENWAELLNAYEDGKAAIRSASTSEAKQAALDAALAAMAAVEKKSAAAGDDILSADGNFNAGKKVGTINLTVENTTYPSGAFTGVFISKSGYPLGENDTMMTVILRALAEEGYSWGGTGGSDYSIGYLSSISKNGQSLGEFSGESGSGWMGSINDFLVNEGFPGFSVASGQLSDGDEIRLMFTQNLGEDLGGRWGDKNTTLSSLVASIGTFVPEFASGTAGADYDFALLIPGSSAMVKLTPTAANKNYLVKTFLNEKVTYNNEGNSFYKRTEFIPVKPGDVIYVGVGENAWPSMNKQGAEASSYSGTWYALHVITADDGADYVDELIAALPAAKNVSTSNYGAVQEQIDAIDAVIAVLSSSEKARVNTDALEAVREAVEGFEAVMTLKDEIKALPKNITEADREAVEAAKAAYDALTAAQKNLLTVAETNKLQKAVNTLTLMDKLKTVPDTKDFDSAAAGSKDALIAALKAWLGPDGLNIVESSRIMVEVSSFTEATAGGDGSYSATVSFILGDGSAAATQTKDIRGVITRSGETGVTGIKVSGVPATGSGAAWTATLPYGTDLKTLTGEAFEITLKDEKAQVTEGPTASNNGETWSFIVTALDGTTAAYTVTLSVSEVAVKVLDSWIYSLADDAEPVKLDPAAVTGLLEAVSVDALELPAGTEEAFLWLEVREKAGDNVYEIMPVFAADEEGSGAVPAAALIGKIGLTLPVPGTEYAKVLFGTEYLDAQGDANGIRFDVAEAGDYTLIPDARIATVTFHLCGGSSGEVTDGETVVYYREDLNKALPIAVKDDSGFAGWNAKEDGSGQAYSAVSAALPADLYAVWQTELPEELKITELTTAAAVTSAVEEDGTAVITVKADVPCVVIMKTGDSYERLKPVRNADGSYSFRQENYDESMEFFVAAKGDYDGDGVFRTVDLAKANMDLVANKAIDPLTILIMGVNSGKLRTVDLAMLNLSIINKDLDW